jgi:hypothetical protein
MKKKSMIYKYKIRKYILKLLYKNFLNGKRKKLYINNFSFKIILLLDNK